jgi:hypothetical protein
VVKVYVVESFPDGRRVCGRKEKRRQTEIFIASILKLESSYDTVIRVILEMDFCGIHAFLLVFSEMGRVGD